MVATSWSHLQAAINLIIGDNPGSEQQAGALKKYPGRHPRLVTDNGVQFKGDDFKALIKEFALKDIKIRVRHPESNGVIERFHRSLREEAIGEDVPQDKYDALDTIASWVGHYNNERLHAGLKYLRPVDYLQGRADVRLAERKNKLNKAAKKRREENLKRFCERNDKEQFGGVSPTPLDLSLLGNAAIGARVPSQESPILRW